MTETQEKAIKEIQEIIELCNKSIQSINEYQDDGKQDPNVQAKYASCMESVERIANDIIRKEHWYRISLVKDDDIQLLLSKIKELVAARDDKKFVLFGGDNEYIGIIEDGQEVGYYGRYEDFNIQGGYKFWKEDESFLDGMHVDDAGDLYFNLSLCYDGDSCIEYNPYECSASELFKEVDNLTLKRMLEIIIKLLVSKNVVYYEE